MKVLIVDDESVILQILTRLLIRSGYDVDTANNTREAIEKISTDRSFFAVLCDHDPDECMYTACKQLIPNCKFAYHTSGCVQCKNVIVISKLDRKAILSFLEDD